jgi:two-component system sensor histidine kinase BaeS
MIFVGDMLKPPGRCYRRLIMKISFKMFMVFLATTACSVILVVASNRYFSLWSHETHVQQKLEETLILLADSLAEEYSRSQSWQFLTESSKNWELLMQADQGSDYPEFLAVNADTGLLFRIKDLAGNGSSDPEQLLTPPHSFSLFNPRGELLAGFQGESEAIKKIQIIYNGATVGWLGVNYEQTFPTLDKDVIKKLSLLFNTLGGIIILASIVIVFFFSRHLLRPIQQVSGAMKALTDRNFNVRIPVKRNDELGILAARFNTMAQQLHEYDRNQHQWLSDISHELRTPLAVLTGEIEALGDGLLALDKTAVASLREEAKCIRRIVEDLHFISLAEAGDIPMECKEFKPLPVLTQAICSFENRLRKSGLSMAVDLDPDSADLKIRGDSVRLKQVFSNLIENALRYADKPGCLKIHQYRTADSLVISFEDSGPGAPKEALPHLFKRLYRAEPSRSRKTGGSGLGLAICKTIIDGHRGTISVANSEGSGLRIDISLPLPGPQMPARGA